MWKMNCYCHQSPSHHCQEAGHSSQVLVGGIDESIVPAAGGHAGQELAGDVGSQRWQAWWNMIVGGTDVVISPNGLRRSVQTSLDPL